MTIEEFDTTGWNANSKVIYKGNILCVGSVDFEEKLIGTYKDEEQDLDDTPFDWIRCENAELIKTVSK
jgi:hypothetical protein